MLSLRDALESALVEDPDDLATHYAYADYLQEQGDPRGEFIQVQLALEDPQRSEAERRRLQDRAQELLAEHERAWLGILADDLLPAEEDLRRPRTRRNRLTEYQFARGWLDALALRGPTDFFCGTNLGSLLCLAPEARLLRKLILEYYDGVIEALLDLPSPFLLNLRVFQVGKPASVAAEADFTDVEFSPIADLIANLPHIEELRLFAQGYNVPRLFNLSNLSHLRVLQVYYWNRRHPLEVLAANPALGKLTHLLLRPFGHGVDFAGVRAIVTSPHLRSLTHLQLHRSDLGDVGCTEIVTSGILKRLKVLDLRHGEITDAGASILADCPDLQRLEMLDIERNALTQTGIDALRRVLGPALRGDNQQNEAELAQRQYLYEEDLA